MSSLTSLTLSENFTTANVTDMSHMFSGLSSLTQLDVSSFNTSNVTNMSTMFQNMSSLTALNLTGWDTTRNISKSNWLSGTPDVLNVYCNNPDGGETPNPGEGTVNGVSCAELTPPAVSFAAPSSSHANALSTVSYALTYEIAPSPALASADITFNGESTGCSVSSITNPETVNPVINVTGCTGNGDVSISVAAGKSQLFNTPDLGATSATFTVDNIAPTVSIGLPLNSSFNIAGSVSYPVTYEINPNPALQASDITVNGANTDCSVSINDSLVTVSQCSGNGEISISVTGGKSQDLAGNVDVGAGPSATALVDNVNPTVSFGAPSSATATVASIVSYTLTYEIAPNPELASADITFNGVSAGCNVASITNPGTINPIVNVTGCTGNGSVTLTVAEGQSSDLAGNLDQGATSASFTAENIPPSVSFGDPSSSIANASSTVSYTLTYEIAPNPALASADITFSGASAGCSVSGVTNPETVNPVVNVTGCTGNGEVSLIVAAGKSQNAFGIQDNGANSSTFTVDNTAPSVSIGSPTYVSQGSILFPLSYEFAPTNLVISDITVNGASCTVTLSNETTLNPSVNISSCTAPGNISLSVAEGRSADPAGNLDQGATSQQIYFGNGAPMIFVVKTNNPGESFRLPFVSGYNYNAHVDWGDSSSNTITSFDQIEATHTYTEAGEYTVTIHGQVPAWNMYNANGDNSNNEKLIRVDQLGELGWRNLISAFMNTTNLTQFTVGVTDTSNVTNMRNMFRNMSSLTSLNLSNFTTANVTDMSYMFSGMSALTSLTLPESFTTANVIFMSYMFSGMSALTSLTLPESFTTANVIFMSNMFSGMSSLTSLNLASFNTANVTNMYAMFHGMSALTSLDLSSFNTANVDSMWGMFSGMSSLTSLNLASFDTANVTNMSAMFSGMSSLTSLNLSSFTTSNVTDMYAMFHSMSALAALDLSSFNTSVVTNMGGMFYGMSALTALDLASFDTANVTDMRWMFYGMSSLTALNLSSFTTSNVTDMYAMFYGMSSLTALDLSSFNTANVTNMSFMFNGTSALTSLDLSSFNTANVDSMWGMFSGMSSLTALDLSSFNTAKVDYMGEMFSGMSSLTSLNLTSWDTSQSPYSADWLSGTPEGLHIYCNNPDGGGTGNSGEGTVNGINCLALPFP